MTCREFIAISDKMKVLAAEQMDEDAAVISCTIFVQTKDKEAFEFAAIRRDEHGHVTQDGHGGILSPDSIIFITNNDGSTVGVPFTNVDMLYMQPERSDKNQN